MSIESMLPSNHLILCHRLLFLPSVLPSINVFSSESALLIRWPKYWSFSISPSSEYSGLISFRIDWLIFLLSTGPSDVSLSITIQKHCKSIVSDSLQPARLLFPWNSPGRNTGVGSLSLLQGIFLTPGPNPGLPHCKHILYQPSHQGSPGILERVAYPFSSGSSDPGIEPRSSCIAGG